MENQHEDLVATGFINEFFGEKLKNHNIDEFIGSTEDIDKIFHVIIDDFLLTEQGLNLINDQMGRLVEENNQTTVKVGKWLENVSYERNKKELKTIQEVISRRYTNVKSANTVINGAEKTVRGSIQSIRKTLSVLSKTNQKFSGVIDRIDNFLADATNRTTPVPDALFVAATTLVISSSFQTYNYKIGLIRWDDAIDTVCGDVIKASITALILSSIIAPGVVFAQPELAPIALILSSVIYSVVSAICDSIYEEYLGGKKIREARNLHLEYCANANLHSILLQRLSKMNDTSEFIEKIKAVKFCDEDKTVLLDYAKKNFNFILESVSSNFYPKIVKNEYTKDSDGKNIYISDIEGIYKKYFPQLEYFDYGALFSYSKQIHQIYWSYLNSNPKKKVSIDKIKEDLKSSLGTKKLDYLVKTLLSFEEKRVTKNAALVFKVTFEKTKFFSSSSYRFLLASNICELCFFIKILQTYKINPELPFSNIKSIKIYKNEYANAIKEWENNLDKETPKILKRYYDDLPKHTPEEFINPFYTKDLFYELVSFDRYLYSSSVNENNNIYISIPNVGENDKAVNKRLNESCNFIDNINENCFKKIDIFSENKILIILMGYKHLPLHLYTASLGDYAGKKVVDLYAPSRPEIYCKLIKRYKQLEGIRPGIKIISDILQIKYDEICHARTNKNTVFEDGFEKELTKKWIIQNQIIRQICFGVAFMEKQANIEEVKIFDLAGDAVVYTYYKMFTQSMRQDFVSLLQDAKVRQSLRYEIIQACICLQGIHAIQPDILKLVNFQKDLLKKEENLNKTELLLEDSKKKLLEEEQELEIRNQNLLKEEENLNKTKLLLEDSEKKLLEKEQDVNSASSAIQETIDSSQLKEEDTKDSEDHKVSTMQMVTIILIIIVIILLGLNFFYK